MHTSQVRAEDKEFDALKFSDSFKFVVESGDVVIRSPYWLDVFSLLINLEHTNKTNGRPFETTAGGRVWAPQGVFLLQREQFPFKYHPYSQECS